MIRVLEIAIFLIFAISVVSTFVWRLYFKPVAERQQAEAKKGVAGWTATLDAVANIRSEWVEYDTTDSFLLALPSMNNRSIPEVDAYQRLMLRLSTDYPSLTDLRKGKPDSETLDFLKQIIEAHSKAKSRARQIDS